MMMRVTDDPGAGFVRELKSDQLEALVETIYVVAFADGHYGEEERAHFENCVALLTGGRLAGSHFDEVVGRAMAELRQGGRQAWLGSLRERLPSARLRQIALILAMDMAAADGVLHEGERSLIESLGRAFGMNESATREILEGPQPSPS